VNPSRQQFQYDPIYRLVKATGRELTALAMPSATDFANNIPIPNPGNNVMQNYTEYFTYDQIGNITVHDHYTTGQSPNWSKDYVYNSNNNYLLKHDTNQTLDDYTYDAHGNITSMPHLTSMQWDYKDQLREVELNLSGDTAYYIYDNTGNRVRKVIEKGSIREERYYAGGYEVYRKFVSGDLDFERQTLHVDDDKSKVALIETKTVEDGDTVSPLEIIIRYQYSNHLGTACLELDDTADIISYEEYHPFGTTSYRSGRNQVDVSLKRYKYVGKERDEETGLYYYGARYYADWLCRFVSVDPLQNQYPQLTPYNYAGNKPITHIDIDGMQGTGDYKYTWSSATNNTPPVNVMSSTSYTVGPTDSGGTEAGTKLPTENLGTIGPDPLPYNEFDIIEARDPSGHMMNWMKVDGQWSGTYKAIEITPTGSKVPTSSTTTTQIPKINLNFSSGSTPAPATYNGNNTLVNYPQNSTILRNEDENNRAWYSYDNQKKLEAEAKRNQALKTAAEYDPVSFSPGSGAVPCLYQGMEQMPFLMIEGAIVGKIESTLKSVSSFQKFAQTNTGVFKGTNSMQLRWNAYKLFKTETILLRENQLKVIKPSTEYLFKSGELFHNYHNIKKSFE